MNINRLQNSLSTYLGLSVTFTIHTPEKPNISIYIPYRNFFYGPLPARALGRRTPGLCLGPALDNVTLSKC